MYEIDIFTI